MMKKVLILTSIVLLLTMTSVYSAEYPILDDWLEIRKARIGMYTETRVLVVEGLVSYFDELGSDASQLSSFLDDFKSHYESLKLTTTHAALNSERLELWDINVDMALELRSLRIENLLSVANLTSKIEDIKTEHQSEIDALEDNYWSVRKTNMLAVFDLRVDKAQDVLDKLDDKGYDITEAQAKLDEIKAKRVEMEDALDQRDGVAVGSVRIEIYDLGNELRQIVRDLQVEVSPLRGIEYWLDVGDKIQERLSMITSELEELGLDVSELNDIKAQAESDLDTAEEKWLYGDFDAAEQALEDYKNDLQDFVDAYQILVYGRDISIDIEQLIETIRDVIEELE